MADPVAGRNRERRTQLQVQALDKAVANKISTEHL